VFAHVGIVPTLTSTSLVLIGAALLQGVLFSAQNWLMADLQKRYIASWQDRLFADFVGSQWSYFASQKVGEMLNLIIVECPRLGAAFFAIMQLINAVVILSVYLAISFFVSWELTLYLLCGALVLLVLATPVRRASRLFGAEFGAVNAALSVTLNEMLAGVKFIKASAGEVKAKALVAEQIERVRHNLTWSAYLPTTIRVGFEFAGILMILGALIYGLKVEQVSAAQLLVLVALVARLFPRLLQTQQFHNNLNLSGQAFTVLNAAHERFATHQEKQGSATSADIGALLPADIGARDLVVCYGNKVVLDRISFVIPSGRIVGFVGPSGAGKSTLLDVLLGLLEPEAGAIFIGQVPLRSLDLPAWRRKIGYVSQDTFLFHDTIANNIRWGAPEATMDAIRSAARGAGLEPFVSSLPSGYETIVGDRGAKLSGGQRQRISIARALVREPALLILDEATSALDSLSEQEVMSVISNLNGKMTIVIVAHRLAAVRHADLIYVLDQGKLVEQGSWASLSGQTTLFQRLMHAQAVSGHG